MEYLYLVIFIIGVIWTLCSIFFNGMKETGKVKRLIIERDLLLLVICLYIVYKIVIDVI